MKIRILLFSFFNSCALYGAHISTQKMINIPVKHFTYQKMQTATSILEYKELKQFFLPMTENLAYFVFSAFCFDEKMLPKDNDGVCFKTAIARIINKNVDDFIVANRRWSALDAAYGIEKVNEEEYKEAYNQKSQCLYIYDKIEKK